eukprot:scaffold8927_cov176-Amphora_coffeaeformis.AAC.3
MTSPLMRACLLTVFMILGQPSLSATALSNAATKSRQRRELLRSTSAAILSGSAVCATNVPMVHAKSGSNISPDEAFENLILGREELITVAKKYLAKRDLEGMRDYLEDDSRQINQYETNTQVLLTSKRLDVESKKAIGTIRRYGVGADVMIMYGGLRAELDDTESANFNQVQNYLVKTLDSLEEVIVICRSNGLGKEKQ